MKIFNLLRSYAVFLIIPAVATILSFILRIAAGHFWLDADPSYIFLFNALHMVKGIAPTHTDHPGTPVILLILLIIHMLNFGSPVTGTLNRVFLNPEFYLYVTFYVLVLSAMITSVLLASYVYIKTRDKIAGLLTQLPWLCFFSLKAFESSYPVPPVMINIGCEYLLIVFTNLFNLFFLGLFFSKSSRQEPFFVLMLSLVCGLGVATKLTFIPLVIVALVIFSWRFKIPFIAGFILFFVLGTYPIISKYPIFFKTTLNEATHTGLYGTGDQGFTHWSVYWSNLKLIAHEYWFFMFTTLSLLIWSTLQFMKDRENRSVRFLWVATLGTLLDYLLVAKHFSFHYLLTGFSLFSSIFCLFYLQKLAQNKIFKGAIIISIFFFCAITVCQNLIYSKNMSEFSNDVSDLYEKVGLKYPNSIIIPANTIATSLYITPKHALFLGNYVGLHNENEELANLFPRSYFFNTEMTEPRDYDDGYGIRDFYGNRVFADDLLSYGIPVIFIKMGDDFSDYGMNVRLIERSKYVTAYLLLSSTEKEAYALFLESQVFLKQGRYPEAFALALKSRELNFQPRGKIEYYLSSLYPHLQHQ